MIVPFVDDRPRQATLRIAAAHARPGRQHHRARSVPVGGAALPDDADHRSLGDLDRHRAAASAPRAAGERAGGVHHQFLRPVAHRRGISGLRDPQHREQPHQPGGVLLRAHRKRRGRQHEGCAGADVAPAQARLRRGARRFRHRPVVAVVPALHAGVDAQDRWQLRARHPARTNAPNRWCAPSRSWRAP